MCDMSLSQIRVQGTNREEHLILLLQSRGFLKVVVMSLIFNDCHEFAKQRGRAELGSTKEKM
jgi:hypothetical protein